MINRNPETLPQLLSTSVVRGSQQGESHGGIYLTDLNTGRSKLMLDWNTCDIDFTGRGADRGLRGIAFYGDEIFIAASDELFVFNQDFEIIRSYRNRYLKHCHEIAVYGTQLFMTSTGYDSVLVFNLETESFEWGVHVRIRNGRIFARTFDPARPDGPPMKTELHINSVFCNTRAIAMSGLRDGHVLRFRSNGIDVLARVPKGTHNMQACRNGLLFNDTNRDRIYFKNREMERTFDVPRYKSRKIINRFGVSDRVARPGFARGLCQISSTLIAGGSSPSTISIYDLESGKTLRSVNLSMDIRNAIHGLEVWPFQDTKNAH